MTPQPSTIGPETLTDEQLIEAVAVEVMGYEKCERRVCPCTQIGCSGWLTIPKGFRWNPLTDWNHWREVEEKIMADGTVLNGYIRILVEEVLGDDLSRASGLRCFIEADLRSRCIAALKAVRSKQ